MHLEFEPCLDHGMLICSSVGILVWAGYSIPSSPLRKFRAKFEYAVPSLSNLGISGDNDFPQIRDLKKAQFLWAGLETSTFENIILFNKVMDQVPSRAVTVSRC